GNQHLYVRHLICIQGKLKNYLRYAVDGKYIDKKCSFTGNVVLKMRMTRTVVIRYGYLYYVRKYCQFEKRDFEIMDVVTAGECKPLSKTAKDNVLKVTRALGSKKDFSKVQLDV
ncbi:unnamed protein product, partial [Candidula unifasciata]